MLCPTQYSGCSDRHVEVLSDAWMMYKSRVTYKLLRNYTGVVNIGLMRQQKPLNPLIFSRARMMTHLMYLNVHHPVLVCSATVLHSVISSI